MRNTPIHAGRSFRFTLALALCAGFCLTVGQAEAGPPRDSDVKDIGLSEKQCKDKLIRRDSFQGILTGTECGDFCYAGFKLPSGAETGIMCGEEQANKWYGGENQGKMVTVHYEVHQFWNEYGLTCDWFPVCTLHLTNAQHLQFMKSSAEYREADERLTAAWKQVKNRLSPERFQIALAEQRTWVKTGRDDAAVRASFRSDDGLWLSPVEAFTQVTEERAWELERLAAREGR